MKIHHYNCLLFIIITPSVTDVHMMLKRGKIMRRGFGQQDVAKNAFPHFFAL